VTVWHFILRSLAAVVLIAYPALVYFGRSSGTPRQVSLVLLLAMAPALLLRMRSSAHQAVRGLAAAPITIIAILLVAAVLDKGDFILATPVATNCVLLIAFGATLRRKSMPMIERFARLQVDELNSEQQAWCRMWTWIWCAFFIANGSTALALATWGPMKWWALYNGFICYGLIGVLFATEWCLRHRRFPEIREGKSKA
jgi:uncharacterized membrane protein